MGIIDEIMRIVEKDKVVKFNAHGSSYMLEVVDDEWRFSVNGDWLCYGCELESVRDCILDECDPEEIMIINK